jgi:hypothetical protein
VRRRVLYSHDELAVAATVGTVLLVVIAVALAGVVGLFMFDVIRLPEDPPDVEVVYTHVGESWGVHVSDVSEEYQLSDFRLLAHHPDGNFVQYDPDGDAIANALMVVDLPAILAGSGSGPSNSPVVFLDVDGDGKVSAGDQLIAQGVYVPQHSALMDGTRGYKKVGLPPHGIPMGSDLFIAATPVTLVLSDLAPGDEVNVEIKHGSLVEATRNGHASASGTFTAEVYMDPAWHGGNHKAVFTVRPGEADEWTDTQIFHTKAPQPLTPEEEAQYEELKRPLRSGDVISLVHKPSNQVILEFIL